MRIASPVGEKMPTPELHQIVCPRRERPVNGLRNDDINVLSTNQRHRTREGVLRKRFAHERRREMAVIPREVGRNARARIRQCLADAVRE